MPGTNLTRDEAAARAALLKVEDYAVHVDLTTGPTTFTTTSRVRFDAATPGAQTFIDFVGEAVTSITLNGTSLDPGVAWADSRITLPELQEHNELVVEAVGRYTNSGEGLHRFVDPIDGEVYLYSQFEVPDARRVFAVFEQPDLKARFAFSVTAPAYWQVISNQPTPAPQPAGPADGVERATWHFPPTPRLSSYVTALVAGPYDVVRDEARCRDAAVPLGVFSRRSLTQFVDHEAIFDLTKRGLAFFEAEFDSAYPFEKYDQIFVPEYNAGAMENVGCVTITEVYVFRGQPLAPLVERRALTILHEIAHMWFGDLVTMTWWDDLWLNESFAEWASSTAQAEATRWTEAWTTFHSHEKTWAYQQDQLRSTHPVYADIRDLEDVLINFDGITYAKGGSVLKQLVAFVGRQAFVAGLRRYFREHAWQNTTMADLFRHIQAESGRDLDDWARRWLRTAGVSTLAVVLETDDADRITSARVEQTATEALPQLRPHRVALGRYEMQSGFLTRVGRHEVDVDGPVTEVPDLVGHPRPDLLLPNDDDLTYAKIRLDERSTATALAHPDLLTDSLARSVVIGSFWELVKDGELAARDFIDFLLTCLSVERHPTVVRTVLLTTKQIPSLLTASINWYTAPEHQEATAERVRRSLRAAAEAAEPGSDKQLQLVTAYASLASPQDAPRLRAALDGTAPYDGLLVSQDMRWTLLTALAAIGSASASDIDAELERDPSAAGRQKALMARAARPTPEAKAEAWHLAIDEAGQTNAAMEHLGNGLRWAIDPQVLEPYIAKYHDMVLPVWQSRSFAIRERAVEFFYPLRLAGPQLRDATAGWLAAHPDAPAALRRLVSERLDEVEVALRAQARDAQRG